MHLFSFVCTAKIQLGLYEGLAFLPWLELKNYTSVYTRLGLYVIIYGICKMMYKTRNVELSHKYTFINSNIDIRIQTKN